MQTRQFSHPWNENQLIKRVYTMTGKPRPHMPYCAIRTLCEPNRCRTRCAERSKLVHTYLCQNLQEIMQGQKEGNYTPISMEHYFTIETFKYFSIANFPFSYWNFLNFSLENLKHFPGRNSEYFPDRNFLIFPLEIKNTFLVNIFPDIDKAFSHVRINYHFP